MTPEEREAREIAYTSRSSYESARLFLEQIEGLDLDASERTTVIEQYKRNPAFVSATIGVALEDARTKVPRYPELERAAAVRLDRIGRP